jgi:uncharacterized phage protein gp47/JayE
MANFPTPSQINDQYKQILKSIKPSLNLNDQNSDFVIRGKAFTGLISGLYGDQKKVDNDSFISNCRPEALDIKGQDYGILRQPSTQAISAGVQVTGTDGTIINVGDLTLVYSPTGILYSNTIGGTISGGILILTVQCEASGQIGNISSPDTLQIVSPPPGVDTDALLLINMADGADVETNDSYRARLLSREQSPPAGGNETDYPNFAFAADPSVRSAFIRRFGRGLGTVDVYITSGTTDIDTAVTNGIPIVRIPGPTVISTVQAYYNANAPLTDCAAVFAPTETPIDVTINVDLASGLTLSSIPSDPTFNPLSLNIDQLIEREISRVLYRYSVGGRILPTTGFGYVIASDIEEGLDVWLSAVKDPITGFFIGKIPVLVDRQCQKLDGANYDKVLIGNQLPEPGTLTTILGV